MQVPALEWPVWWRARTLLLKCLQALQMMTSLARTTDAFLSPSPRPPKPCMHSHLPANVPGLSSCCQCRHPRSRPLPCEAGPRQQWPAGCNLPCTRRGQHAPCKATRTITAPCTRYKKHTAWRSSLSPKQWSMYTVTRTPQIFYTLLHFSGTGHPHTCTKWCFCN